MTPTLRPYLVLLGATLLGQGLVSLALHWSGHASNQLPNRFANSDPRHAFVHVIWGAVILVLVVRGLDARGYARLALAFGVFYTALAVLGVVVHHPLGLRLDRGENVFHFIVGPITLALAAVAYRLNQRLPA
ncbi:MAG TPA: hypothetical protein VGI72_01230 [Gaiellales bacterium]|jgi:hypothetical protein